MSIKYVEYLEADGNSYFELPAGTITWNSNSGIEVQYYHNAYVANSYLIGAYGQNGHTSIATYYEKLSVFMFEQKFDKEWYTNDYKQNIQPYVHTIKIDKNGSTFDGVTQAITWSESESWVLERINLSPVRIFGQGSNQGDNYKYVALQGTRIYYVKIYNGDEVVHYFRPCLKGNTPCMYDEISKTFYYNQGTGTFGYGKALNTLHLFANNNEGTAENLGSYRLYNMKIDGDSEGVESGIDYVDCLIGDGASYIDTGMAIPSGYKVEVTFMSTVNKAEYINNDWCAIFGCSNAIGYSYDSSPYGISAGLYSTNISVKNNGQTIRQYADISNTCYNKKYTLSLTAGENNTNPSNVLVFANNNLKESGKINPYPFSYNYLRIYDFKIYNTQETLIQHLKPCLDEEGIPCMYDEVSGEYFHNQGSGTFGYKKKLRDFQPVLDSNGVPCLMDKVNKKYYYDKNGKGFRCDRYSGVSYLKGDGASWIDTGLIANQMHGYRIETKIINRSVNGEQVILFGSSYGGLDNANTNCHLRYNYYGYPQGLTFIDDGGTGGGWSMKVNETYSFVMTINQPTSSSSFYLFAGNQKDTPIGTCDCGIYYWKVYDTNNNLIQHLIPAIDIDGSIGMYDLVTETFFYNQGTGTFSYGIEEEECPKVANAIDYIKKISGNNNDYFRTKNFNGLINENLIIKTKIALGSVRDNNGAYFQIVGQYNTNRLYLGYKKTNNQLEYAFFGANDSVTLTDYDVFNDEVWEIELSKNGLTVNGVFIKSLESDITGTSLVVPLYIFQTVTYQDKPSGNALPGQKIYELIFEQDGQIIANFQPCLDDNENLCFCDIVDNTYYYPTLGTSYEYNQLLQTPIKYIETNGTQYIDTGVVPTDNTDIDMVARACESKTIALDYFYENTSTHYYTPKFACSELNNVLINNSEHSIVVDFYGDNGAWKWQGEIKSGTTENLSQHSYVAVRFTAKDQINYVNDYIFIQGEQSYSSKPGNTDLVISLQDCMSIGYLMNDLIIGGTYKFKETNTTVEPNLTASEGATLTLGSTYMSYLSEEELEQATKNGWIIE